MEKIEIIELERPSLSAKNVGFIIGALIMFIGIIAAFTIIAPIPGIITAVIGMIVAYANVLKAAVNCPSCDTINRAAPPTQRIECAACSNNIPIKWKKP